MIPVGTQNRSVLAWFTRNPVAANLLMALILVFGLVTALTIRTEAFPPFPPNSLNIQVSFPGNSAEELEESIAVKIEESLNGIAGIKQMITSISDASVTVQLISVDGYSLKKLKEDVKTRVDGLSTLPQQAEKPVITEETDERHVLSIEISGDARRGADGGVNSETLEKTAKRIRDELAAIPEVSKVKIAGLLTKEISIEVSRARLQEYDLTIEQVAQSARRASINQSGGTIKTDYGNITLSMHQQAYQAMDFADVVVRQNDSGSVVYLSDVATIREQPIEQHIFNRFNGKDTLSIAVSLQGNDSVTVTADAVKARLEKIKQAAWMPAGIELTVWKDSSRMIGERLSLMGKNALFGMLLVALLLALFLNLRIALWVALGIPVAFAGAFILMGPQFLNYSLNELTTFGFIMVLGIVVDDAIVIGEAVYTEKEHSADKTETSASAVETTIRGASRVAVPATFGVLTTVAAFLPLLFVSSQLGALFGTIAMMVIICLLFSLVESKWILPSHLAQINVHSMSSNSNALSHHWQRLQHSIEQALQTFVTRYYQPVFHWAIEHRYTALCLFVAVFIVTVGLVAAGQVRTVFFPDIESGNVQAKLVMQAGYGRDRLEQVSKAIEQAALQTREAIQSDYPQDFQLPNSNAIRHSYSVSEGERKASFFIELASDAERSFTINEVIERWRQQIDQNIAGLDGIKSLDVYAEGPEAFSDIEIYLAAPNKADLDTIAEGLKQKLRSYKGLNNIKTGQDEGELELDIQLKPEAYRLGLNETAIAQQLRHLFYGYEVQRIQRGREELRAWVRYPRNDRDQLSDLNRVIIKTPAGQEVLFNAVASFERKASASSIVRLDKHHVVSVTAQSDKDTVSATRILAHLKEYYFPGLQAKYPGLTIIMDGEAAEEDIASGSLLTGFIMGLCLIYGLLAIPLKSYLQPLVIMAVIPFGIIGAILGHLVMGMPLNLLSFFGVLALSGVVVNDALVLTNRYNDFIGEGLDYSRAIWAAARSRFRAILLTSITTFAGLLPLLFERSEQAQVLIPMAISLGFGILFATVINLLIVPVLLGVSQDVRFSSLSNRLNWRRDTVSPSGLSSTRLKVETKRSEIS